MWIEFSDFNFKLFILLIYPLFMRIEKHLSSIYFANDTQLFSIFRYYLSFCLCFIPCLIIKIRTKNRNDSRISINKFANKSNKKNFILRILFLIVLCGLSMFSCFYFSIFYREEFSYTNQSLGTFFYIIFYVVLSHFILKQKLYKHNFICLGIISFDLLLILFVITLFYMDGGDIIPSIFFQMFFALLFGSFDILGRKYMDIYFNTPYFLHLIIGIINLVLILIVELFINILDLDINGVIIGFKNNINSVAMIFNFILDIILQCLWTIGIRATVYYFTPCHFFISNYISEYIYYLMIALSVEDDFYSTSNIVIFSIIFFINLFCCLIFNEVIILNFWKLDYNTRKRIHERQSVESIESIEKYTIELDGYILKDEEESEQ